MCLDVVVGGVSAELMDKTGVCEKFGDVHEFCFNGNNCSSASGCECVSNDVTGPCKAGSNVYNKEDFGKKCTTTSCTDATVATPNDTTPIPSLTEGVTPHKCTANNEPTWTGDVCMLNGNAADKYLPVCIKDKANADECACLIILE